MLALPTLPVPAPDSLKQHPCVWLAIALSGIAFALAQTLGLDAMSEWFLPSSMRELGSTKLFWQFWSPSFIHYTFLHFITNIYLWWLYGSTIEKHGHRFLLNLFLIGALISNTAQWLILGPNFGGLSGVMYAALGYCVVMEKVGQKKDFRVDDQLTIVVLLLIPISASGYFGKFADAAHISGCLCGAGLALLSLYNDKIFFAKQKT